MVLSQEAQQVIKNKQKSLIPNAFDNVINSLGVNKTKQNNNVIQVKSLQDIQTKQFLQQADVSKTPQQKTLNIINANAISSASNFAKGNIGASIIDAAGIATAGIGSVFDFLLQPFSTNDYKPNTKSESIAAIPNTPFTNAVQDFQRPRKNDTALQASLRRNILDISAIVLPSVVGKAIQLGIKGGKFALDNAVNRIEQQAIADGKAGGGGGGGGGGGRQGIDISNQLLLPSGPRKLSLPSGPKISSPSIQQPLISQPIFKDINQLKSAIKDIPQNSLNNARLINNIIKSNSHIDTRDIFKVLDKQTKINKVKLESNALKDINNNTLKSFINSSEYDNAIASIQKFTGLEFQPVNGIKKLDILPNRLNSAGILYKPTQVLQFNAVKEIIKLSRNKTLLSNEPYILRTLPINKITTSNLKNSKIVGRINNRTKLFADNPNKVVPAVLGPKDFTNAVKNGKFTVSHNANSILASIEANGTPLVAIPKSFENRFNHLITDNKFKSSFIKTKPLTIDNTSIPTIQNVNGRHIIDSFETSVLDIPNLLGQRTNILKRLAKNSKKTGKTDTCIL